MVTVALGKPVIEGFDGRAGNVFELPAYRRKCRFNRTYHKSKSAFETRRTFVPIVVIYGRIHLPVVQLLVGCRGYHSLAWLSSRRPR